MAEPQPGGATGTGPSGGAFGPSPRRRIAGLILGLLVFAGAIAADPPPGLGAEAWRVAALALLMAVWWVTEAVPVAATALLPLALLPPLGVGSFAATATSYANPLIFLFLGGFLVGAAVQRWDLHRRIALAVLARVGSRPGGIVAGFMASAAFLSMWVSNTATAVMMLPIAASVCALIDERGGIGGPGGRRGDNEGFAPAMLLGIAYGCSAGGIATLVGTPPNALLAAYLAETHGIRIGFAAWMAVGLPVAVVLLAAIWLVLTKVVFRVSATPIAGFAAVVRAERARLGPFGRGERLVASVFAATALLWIIRPVLEDWLPGIALSDPGIAIAAGVVLFALPVDWRAGTYALDWEAARGIPWAVLILFGGGLALASAIEASGLATWLGRSLHGVADWPAPVLLLAVVALIVLLTELTSNTATTATFLPVVAPLAVAMGEGPAFLAVPVAIGASCAFMLPVATPPNAVVYASGRVGVAQMARAGALLNLIAIAAIATAAYLLVPLALG